MKIIPLLKTNKIAIPIIISIVLIISVIPIMQINFNKMPTTNSETKQEQVQKKIDVTKEWVYDADYGFENKILKDPYDGREVFNSKEELIPPYININSEYANVVNNVYR